MIGRTPSYQTSHQLEHHFSNIEPIGLEKAWLAGPKLGLACEQKKLAYVRLGLACMKAWLDKTSLNQAFLELKPSLSDIIF